VLCTWRYFARSGVSPSLGATFTAVAMTSARTSANISGSSVARCVMSAATSSSDEPGLPVSEPCRQKRVSTKTTTPHTRTDAK